MTIPYWVRIFAIILFFFSQDLVICSYGQSINTDFGKNRVQYHDDFNNWWQYETENFITYWYGKARNVAIPTMQLLELDHDEIQKLMEHKINDKIEVIVYLDISDLKQTNIGTEETFVNKTGETKIIGNKMFVYFDGNHQNLRKKIKEGIANVFLNNMLFGSNIQEIIQNAVLMDIPEWFKQGIVSYAASNWDHLVDDELRDIWLKNPKMRNFKKLSIEHPRVAGHAFWYYIEQNYGRSSISNLLYLTKISRGISNSFLYVYNDDLPKINDDWTTFYKNYYNNEEGLFQQTPKSNYLKTKKKKFVPISHLALSPSGTHLVYVTNDRGKFNVFVKNLKTKEEKRIFKYGFVNEFQETDFSYPTISWHPTKHEISFCYEHKDVIRLRKVDLKTNKFLEQIIPEAFQRIYSLDYINDLDFVMSASMDGFSDLILYKSKTRNHSHITQDFYDDLDATVCTIDSVQGVLFASNRTSTTLPQTRYDTILPIGNFGIYFYPLENSENQLKSIANSNYHNLRYPYKKSDSIITYQSSESGMINIYQKNVFTNVIVAMTNLDRNIIRYSAASNSETLAYTYYKDGEYKLTFKKHDPNINILPNITPLQKKINNRYNLIKINTEEKVLPEKKIKVNDNLLFQSKYPDPPNVEPILNVAPKIINKPTIQSFSHYEVPKTITGIKPFIAARAIAANKKFSLHNVTTKFDNDILFEGLESYTGDRQRLLGTPMGFLLKANLKDLFEDYSLDIGLRLPLALNGSEYFLVFDNKKSLIDKKYALYRKTQTYVTETEPNSPVNFPPRSKKTSLLGLYQWKIPLNIYKSFRATSSLRFDKFMQLSTENTSFRAPAINEQRVSLRLEYIYDNSHDESMNIKFGTRYKFYVEGINEFNIQVIDGFEFDLNRGLTGIVGFDARHYIPLLYRSVLALRGAGAFSFGSKKMLYYLGGMENWVLPRFDSSIPERQDADFAYKANIGQMRGFDNNIRNGSSYLLSNVEVRIPFMQYILGKSKGSAFFRNMQLTGFLDAGMAWHGLTPYSPENPLNKINIESPPIIRLEIEYFRDPLVMGMGYGFRTQILGYFIKFDYGWGIETRKIQEPKFYISFGTDF